MSQILEVAKMIKHRAIKFDLENQEKVKGEGCGSPDYSDRQREVLFFRSKSAEMHCRIFWVAFIGYRVLYVKFQKLALPGALSTLGGFETLVVDLLSTIVKHHTGGCKQRVVDRSLELNRVGKRRSHKGRVLGQQIGPICTWPWDPALHMTSR